MVQRKHPPQKLDGPGACFRIMDFSEFRDSDTKNHKYHKFKQSASSVFFLKLMEKNKFSKKVTFLCFWSIFASVVRGIHDELKKRKTLHAPVVSRLNSKNPLNSMFESTSLVRVFMK